MKTLTTRLLWLTLTLLPGCGGPEFTAQNPPDDSTVADAGALRDSVSGQADGGFPPSVDGGTDASATVEASTDASDAGAPSCPAEEAFPAMSGVCRAWIQTTPYPLQFGCCKADTHTCGMVQSPLPGQAQCLDIP